MSSPVGLIETVSFTENINAKSFKEKLNTLGSDDKIYSCHKLHLYVTSLSIL